MKTILVTGGFGILGSCLVKKLAKNNKVYVLERKVKKRNIRSLGLPKNVTKIYGNFEIIESIKKLILKYNFDVIFHLGAITQVIDSFKSPIKAYKTNIMGTINICESIRLLNKKIILIYSSSDKAYGEMSKLQYIENDRLQGQFPYDVSKSSSDLLCQSYSLTYDLKIGIVRSGNIFGPGDFNLDRLIPGTIVETIKNKNIVIRSNGKLRRDYIYVEDVARGYEKLMNKMFKSKSKLHIYNLGSKYNYNALEVVMGIYRIMRKKNLRPIVKNLFTDYEIKNQKLSYKKAKVELNWNPTISFDKGIRKTIQWYKKNINEFKTT